MKSISFDETTTHSPPKLDAMGGMMPSEVDPEIAKYAQGRSQQEMAQLNASIMQTIQLYADSKGKPNGFADDEEVDMEDFHRFLDELEKQEAEREQTIQNTEMDIMFPDPGFVVKVREDVNGQPGGKVFINVCQCAKVGHPSRYNPETGVVDTSEVLNIAKALKDQSMSANVRVPISLGQPKSDKDAKGSDCLVFDVVFHPDTLTQAEESIDTKYFIIEMALEWIEEKHKLVLERDAKFPKMKYKGSGDPEPHNIRVPKKSKITQLDDSGLSGPVMRPQEGSSKIMELNGGGVSGNANRQQQGKKKEKKENENEKEEDNGVFFDKEFARNLGEGFLGKEATDKKKHKGIQEVDEKEVELQKSKKQAEQMRKRANQPEVEFFQQETSEETGKKRYVEIEKEQLDGLYAMGDDDLEAVRPPKLLVRLFVPDLESAADMELNISSDELEFETDGSHGDYYSKMLLPFAVDESKSKAKFDKQGRVLSVFLPTIDRRMLLEFGNGFLWELE
eukprot:TRINITY_DN934_c0_g1_i13.p1 TRINITY_DN934_c0_g1~~TRINITY_DN934_c0_g1_i13.p1  ORF type:complete len:506 (+),score=191.71 TRINITY_DN934_c0_g1_i13:902-2419(+)